MRHRVLAASGGIDWSAPRTLAVSPNDSSQYTLGFTSSGAVSESHVLLDNRTAPLSGQTNVVVHAGRVTTNDADTGTFSASVNYDSSDIVIVPAATYRISGEVELDPAEGPGGTDWDAQAWTFFILVYTGPNQTGTPSFAWTNVQPKTSDGTTVVAASINDTFAMPAGTKSFTMGYTLSSKFSTSSAAMYFWDWELELV